ncbi:MAG TPA: hypothetical protein VM238_16890 [Phycisphaerae bacterium]|nr:hypothetical protein [Phycisphaerae bacterium]
MNTSLKFALVAAAAVVLGTAAEAQAGGIVFWGGGTRVITTSHAVVPAIQPVVMTTQAPALVVTRAYSAGYQDGYRNGYHDGARTTIITTRSIPSVGFPVRAYAPTVVRYRVPAYTPGYTRVHAPTYTLPSTLRILRTPHCFRTSRTRGLPGFFWR